MKNRGGKDVKLASSVTEEGGDSDVSTSCGTDDNASAAMTEDEFNDKWKDEWDDTPTSFECIPWHDDMPEFVEEELDELEETKDEVSPPKRKNRWSSGEAAMNAMFKASDKKFWQSDEDGDDEAVIERVYKMPRRKKQYKHRDKISQIDKLFNSMVARPVGKSEIESQPRAQKALLDEFNSLIK